MPTLTARHWSQYGVAVNTRKLYLSMPRHSEGWCHQWCGRMWGAELGRGCHSMYLFGRTHFSGQAELSHFPWSEMFEVVFHSPWIDQEEQLLAPSRGLMSVLPYRHESIRYSNWTWIWNYSYYWKTLDVCQQCTESSISLCDQFVFKDSISVITWQPIRRLLRMFATLIIKQGWL